MILRKKNNEKLDQFDKAAAELFGDGVPKKFAGELNLGVVSILSLREEARLPDFEVLLTDINTLYEDNQWWVRCNVNLERHLNGALMELEFRRFADQIAANPFKTKANVTH